MTGLHIRCLESIIGTMVGKLNFSQQLRCDVPLGPAIPLPLLISTGNPCQAIGHCIFNLKP